MADNTILNSGSGGDTIATDDISGVKYQRNKITLGADGVNDGDVSSSNPLPISASSLPLPSGAATSSKQDDGNTLLGSIESNTFSLANSLVDAVGVDGAAANTKVLQVAGYDGTNAQFIKTDSSGELQVDVLTMPVVQVGDNGGSLTVDGSVTVTQGTATNLKAQAEVYQGGTAVGAAAPLQVSLANHAANATAVKVDNSAVTQPITTSLTASGNITVLNSNLTGTATAGSAVEITDLKGASVLSVYLSGTWSANIQIQVSNDGSAWRTQSASSSIYNATGVDFQSSALLSNTTHYKFNCAGMKAVRVTATAFTSGTCAVLMSAGSGFMAPNRLNVDLATLSGATVSTGNGTSGTGALRVAVASDNTAFSVLATGAVADDVAASGNPVPIGAVARTTNRTAVADADAVRLIADDIGRMVVVNGQVRDLMTHAHTQIASSSAETTILAAGAAGVFHDITQIVLTNQTATAVNCTIKDATAGTTRMIIALAASGGAVIPFSRPLTQSSAANNWTITLSSAAVTVNVLVQAEKNV